MPTVGGTKFPYTKAGMQEAKAWSEIIGKPVKMPKKKKSYAKPMPRKKGELKTRPIGTRPWQTGPTKATPMKYQVGGFTKQIKKMARGAVRNPAAMGRRGDTAIRPVAGRPSHVNPIEAGMIDMLGPAVGSQFAQTTTDVPGSRNPRTGLPEYSWLSKRFKPSKKAKKWWNKHVKRGIVNTGIQALSGNPEAMQRWIKRVYNPQDAVRGYRDPNLFGARQRFSSGSDISSLMKNLQSGKGQDLGIMEQGGEVPAGRRMYGTNPKKKKKYPMQTSTAGMPVRGDTYKKGGKAGYHT